MIKVDEVTAKHISYISLQSNVINSKLHISRIDTQRVDKTSFDKLQIHITDQKVRLDFGTAQNQKTGALTYLWE